VRQPPQAPPRSDVPVGVVEVPRGVRIAWSRGDDVWGVEPDDLGVPWLVRFRLVRDR